VAVLLALTVTWWVVSSYIVGSAQSAGTVTIQTVAWLQGCWTLESAQRLVEESWMAPRGGSMIGVSRTIRDGKLVDYELIVLREQGGRLAYHAHPSGQPSTVFLSTNVTGSGAVFENPEHDFPQKVGYQRNGDALTAWIEGTANGRARRVEFPYRRTSCPGS
jgi:hypothetical protein